MNRELVLIPSISIHPDKICTYSQVHWFPNRPVRPDKIQNHEDKIITYNHLLKSRRSAMGLVSDIARRKISRSLDYLLLLSQNKNLHSLYLGRNFQFKIGFITLTLPAEQMHSDNVIKSKCLNSILIELKKYHKVKNYVWRAEKQKNGNIHFHIIVDKFIPWSKLRDRWNRIIEKLGYITAYRESMLSWHKGGFKIRTDLLKKWEYRKQIKAYETGSKNDWNSPNTTDVHSIKKVINLKNYISKYLTKNETSLEKKCKNLGFGQKLIGFNCELRVNKKDRLKVKCRHRKDQQVRRKQLVKGRIWGCNKELSNIKGATLDVDSEIWDNMNEVIKNSNCKQYSSDYFNVFYIDFRDLAEFGGEILFNYFCSYLVERFGYNYQLAANF